MLTLTHTKGQSIKIGDNITIIIQQTSQQGVVVSYDAPRDVQIIRHNAKVRAPKA